jgi:hypothetical protein
MPLPSDGSSNAIFPSISRTLPTVDASSGQAKVDADLIVEIRYSAGSKPFFRLFPESALSRPVAER